MRRKSWRARPVEEEALARGRKSATQQSVLEPILHPDARLQGSSSSNRFLNTFRQTFLPRINAIPTLPHSLYNAINGLSPRLFLYHFIFHKLTYFGNGTLRAR
jgi:hypothetical protein